MKDEQLNSSGGGEQADLIARMIAKFDEEHSSKKGFDDQLFAKLHM